MQARRGINNFGYDCDGDVEFVLFESGQDGKHKGIRVSEMAKMCPTRDNISNGMLPGVRVYQATIYI